MGKSLKIRLLVPSLVTPITINWAGIGRAKKIWHSATTIDMAVKMLAIATVVRRWCDWDWEE